MFGNTGLGRILTGESLTPPGAPGTREGNPLAELQGATPTAQQTNLQKMLQHPAIMAALVQSAVSMLSQRGIGPSFADAGAAAGRALTGIEARKKKEEEEAYAKEQDALRNAREDRRLDIAERAAAQRVSSGGGRASAAPRPTDNSNEIYKMLMSAAQEEYRAKTRNVLPGQSLPPPPDPLLIREQANVISRFSPEEFSEYLEARRTAASRIDKLSPEELFNYIRLRRIEGADSANQYLDWIEVGKPRVGQQPAPTYSPAPASVVDPGPAPPAPLAPEPSIYDELTGEALLVPPPVDSPPSEITRVRSGRNRSKKSKEPEVPNVPYVPTKPFGPQ